MPLYEYFIENRLIFSFTIVECFPSCNAIFNGLPYLSVLDDWETLLLFYIIVIDNFFTLIMLQSPFHLSKMEMGTGLVLLIPQLRFFLQPVRVFIVIVFLHVSKKEENR